MCDKKTTSTRSSGKKRTTHYELKDNSYLALKTPSTHVQWPSPYLSTPPILSIFQSMDILDWPLYYNRQAFLFHDLGALASECLCDRVLFDFFAPSKEP